MICLADAVINSSRIPTSPNRIMAINRVLPAGQIRMACGYLRWPIAESARASGVGASTIKRAELVDGPPPITGPNLGAIRTALEDAGIDFTFNDEGRVGMRVRPRGADATGRQG